MVMAMAAETGSMMAAAATVAMVVADNNRNCGGRQQSTKCSSGTRPRQQSWQRQWWQHGWDGRQGCRTPVPVMVDMRG